MEKKNSLNVKLKGKSVSYNYALESHKYFFTNDGKVRFNLTIKQRSKEGKMCGDVARDNYSYLETYSPVPRGVGPLTNIALMQNLLLAKEM